jgi:Na+(H+)/acetate symporter ActP
VAFPVAAVFMKKVNRKGVLWSSIFGFCGTILFYFLESEGFLKGIEPQWLLESGLGYILWGMASAAVGYGIGCRRR